jgi:multidrug efflux pump subunit AcrB
MSGPARRRGLPSFAIRRPVGTLMLTLVVVVLGTFFLSGLALDLLPGIVYPTVRANVTNRAVAPEVLEETVAKPLENALATTEGVVSIETDIQEGRVGLNLQFRYGTNIDFALQDASKNLDRVRARLPAEADPSSTRRRRRSTTLRSHPPSSASFNSGTGSRTACGRSYSRSRASRPSTSRADWSAKSRSFSTRNACGPTA